MAPARLSESFKTSQFERNVLNVIPLFIL